MTLDDLERPKRSLAVIIVLRSPQRWKSSKLITRNINLRPSLFVAQRPCTYSRGNRGNLGETEVGCEKVACRSTKAAISLKDVKIEEKLLWMAYRNSSTLFRTVPSPTHYGLLFSTQTSIAGQGEAPDFKFGRYIYRVHLNKSAFKI